MVRQLQKERGEGTGSVLEFLALVWHIQEKSFLSSSWERPGGSSDALNTSRDSGLEGPHWTPRNTSPVFQRSQTWADPGASLATAVAKAEISPKSLG